jgi:hypothetical protein
LADGTDVGDLVPVEETALATWNPDLRLVEEASVFHEPEAASCSPILRLGRRVPAIASKSRILRYRYLPRGRASAPFVRLPRDFDTIAWAIPLRVGTLRVVRDLVVALTFPLAAASLRWARILRKRRAFARQEWQVTRERHA